MEVLIGLVIAGVVAYFVYQDAVKWRDEELAIYGQSSVSPGMWATGVFLLLIVFLPLYLILRSNATSKLAPYRAAASPYHSQYPVAAQTPPVTPAQLRPATERLRELKSLLEQGLITEAAYEQRKVEIMSEI